jgi:uncharacterized protein (DUF433 family)/mRNA-degrading endonuclease toxin of MazEF toxin-antitoxin module
MNPGEIYMADLGEAAPHPVIVVSREELNRGDLVVVVLCTSQKFAVRSALPHCVPFQAGQFGFTKDCVAQCENIFLVSKDSLAAILDDLAFRDLVKAIGHVFDSDCEPIDSISEKRRSSTTKRKGFSDCRFPFLSRIPCNRLRFADRARYHSGMATNMTTPETAAADVLMPVVAEYIAVKPGFCGGKPHVIGHRIKVQHIAVWRERMGMTPEEIAATYPSISLPAVFAALSYYHGHRAQIDADIEADARFVAEMKTKAGPSKLQEKLAALHGEDDPLPPG